jgi:hypothetical protein
MKTVRKTKWQLGWETRYNKMNQQRILWMKEHEQEMREIREEMNMDKPDEWTRKIRERENKKIEKIKEIENVRTLNRLNVEKYCNRESYTKLENEINVILTKTEIERLVRFAYKFYRDKSNQFENLEFTNLENLEYTNLLEKYLTVNPPIYKLSDLREYLKGDRKQNKILTIFLNKFDNIISYEQAIFFERHDYSREYQILISLIEEKISYITCIDKIKSANPDTGNFLEWSLEESKIIKLYRLFVENKIINQDVSLGAFYQIFNNQVANFQQSIQINTMSLSCFLYWSRDRKLLTNKQPFKIIEHLKIFCNTENKPINAHNLNRYLSEYKDDFIECTKPIYSTIKEIIINL